jgi:hypothetical protein
VSFDVSQWFHETITVAAFDAVSGGDDTFAASSTLSARVEQRTGIVVTADGTEAAYTHRIATTTEIVPGSRVWLPGANTGDTNEAMRAIASKYSVFLGGAVGYYLTFF